MNQKTYYKFLLCFAIALAMTGAVGSCYKIFKSKEEIKQQAIERSRLAYLSRPAYQFKTAIIKNDTAMAIDLLQQEGLDLNHPNCQEHKNEHLNESPLLIDVVQFNRLDIAKEMLKYPIDLYAVGENDRTAIEESILLNNPQMLHLLLEKADLDLNKIYHTTGETLLHLAIIYKAEDVIKYLIKKGANPMSQNEQGFLAIDYLNTQKQKDLLLSLYQNKGLEKKDIQSLSAKVEKEKKQLEEKLSPQEEKEFRLRIDAFLKMVKSEEEASAQSRTD